MDRQRFFRSSKKTSIKDNQKKENILKILDKVELVDGKKKNFD